MQVVEVKFNRNGNSARFLSEITELDAWVVVETDNGPELATIIKIIDNPQNAESEELKKVLRKANFKDKQAFKEREEKEKAAYDDALRLIKKNNLEMKLLSATYALDFSKIIFTFTAEGRVDFRELLKDLASALKVRIELRQVGIRDEAKILGGLGPCGREVCCANHLKDFCKVSIKMAKNQNLSLNPANISGTCGRLMCCLSYEDNDYVEVLKKMPKVNSKVKTPNGEGTVIYNNLLKQTVSVKFFKENDITEVVDFALYEISFNRDNNEE